MRRCPIAPGHTVPTEKVYVTQQPLVSQSEDYSVHLMVPGDSLALPPISMHFKVCYVWHSVWKQAGLTSSLQRIGASTGSCARVHLLLQPLSGHLPPCLALSLAITSCQELWSNALQKCLTLARSPAKTKIISLLNSLSGVSLREHAVI